MCLAIDLNGSLCSGRASPSPNANEDQSGGSGGVGGELLCARHQREGINLNRRRGGNTDLRVGDCPPCDTGQDQSGGVGCEHLAHRILLSLSVKPMTPGYMPPVSCGCCVFMVFVSSVSTKPAIHARNGPRLATQSARSALPSSLCERQR